ncbi:Regulator of Vps4 in the MVB pathway [Musa troglodytarum]|uniref:Regulator of Vps4 in the MVB pathway n=1 Tax=Musa troglodytarum TaxID=320322 RepID=A0A9E7KPR9_9LILI|nr:Regulator of Vps4 in the MVB pathway [Musa troglodytarum]URE29228.1 Regulator of Vps4 in the MVB pathway [Musa troglodytarum]
MLCSLLGGKFSNKCKHAVRFIKVRMGPIRNKKQAVVRCLKRDVADLIAAGHEAIAFGRIDALIVEMNHASCYDMIEQFCQYILSQLPSLQKQRECPQEAMEAISTLIFAAARFSDLPELCDLRHAFVERYGSYMESSVKAEFVEKIQEKSFSKKKKLQLLQNIAEEFTLRWDPKTSCLQSHNAPAPKSTRPKEVAASHIVDKGASSAKAAIKEESPSKRKYGSNPVSGVRKQGGEVEQKDIHVISTTINSQSHDQMEKPRSAENTELYQTDDAVRPFVKHKRNHDGIHKNDEINVDHPQSGTEKVQHHSIEKQEVGSVKSQNVAPPDTKSIDNRFHVEETRGGGTVPPYTKLNWIENGHHVEGKIGRQSKGVFRDGKPKPVSMRRKSQRPPVTAINGGAIDGEKTASCTPGDQRRQYTGKRSTGTNDGNFVEEKIAIRESRSRIGDEMDNAIDYGKLLPRSSNGPGRHTAAMNDCQYDEEEMAVEKLLLHYSGKGTARDPIKERTTPNHVDRDRFERPVNRKIQLIQTRAVPPPERAISMPSEPVSPAEVKAPARSTSMQPDPSNPKDGGLHPKLPEFDQLVARLAATKKT